jgi:hypothetical protein
MFKIKDVPKLFDAAGARRLLGWNDPECCPNGADDMLRNPKSHYLKQRANQISDLSEVAKTVRPEHFFKHQLAPAERVSRQAAKLKTGSDSMDKALAKASERLEKMLPVLENLHKTMDRHSHAAAPISRKSENYNINR